uniref:uncharacterized protein LOC120334101 n=1 Tax=Styela clava TaxID=7725 RepID=UPI00193A577B|nr:uncharacterized protein LOC120334101 [Styela clava]
MVKNVIQGNITNPSVAGTVETIVVEPPNVSMKNNKTIRVSYAIKARDEAGNRADVSNIAMIKFYYVPPAFVSQQNNTGLYVGIGILVFVLVVGVGGFLAYWFHRKKKLHKVSKSNKIKDDNAKMEAGTKKQYSKNPHA